MAGMFYSLQEVVQKLDKTENQIKELVKQGKLREFRDGPNLLFKIDEVEALMSETAPAAPEESAPAPEPKAQEDEISLAPEAAEGVAAGSELTEEDTAVASKGINVLGETDSEYHLADDTLGATQAASSEASLEAIDDDVNLDTFGSGSGLLDLSLQADDTSLGGILDEIYTAEGEEEQQTPADGSAMEVAAEAEQILSEGPESIPEPTLEAPVIVQAYAAESEPDALSNALGIMLFVPLLAVIYAAIVTLAGQSNVMPSILTGIQGMIWYVMGGAAAASALLAGAVFMTGSSAATPKVKKAKKPKVKKEKKPKEKKPKKEKKKKS